MKSVLEEVVCMKIDEAWVRRRLENWEQRVRDLYAQIEAWLPEGWTADHGLTVIQQEPMMRMFDIPPPALPTLRLTSETGDTARLFPEVLWIVPTNGRVDLVRRAIFFYIDDYSDCFATPDWRIIPAHQRLEESPPLNRQRFQEALR